MDEYPETLTVHVTEEDIKVAQSLHGSSMYTRVETCPIAIAVSRMGYQGVQAGSRMLEIYGEAAYRYSEAARKFMRVADIWEDANLTPQTFRLKRHY